MFQRSKFAFKSFKEPALSPIEGFNRYAQFKTLSKRFGSSSSRRSTGSNRFPDSKSGDFRVSGIFEMSKRLKRLT
jgi:hypothetical protein